MEEVGNGALVVAANAHKMTELVQEGDGDWKHSVGGWVKALVRL